MSTPDYNKFKRDEHGLLSGVNYVYNSDGSINYRAMIDAKHLVIQKNKEAKVLEQFPGKSINEIDLKQVDDKYLMILLSGIKELAKIRGIKRCTYEVNTSQLDNATVTCTIDFVSNYETDGKEITFSDVGTATLDSTEGFGKLYLATIAANRAFVRAVRNFLNVNIVSKEEVKDGDIFDNSSSVSVSSDKPWVKLSTLASEKKVNFEDIKKASLGKYRAEILGDPEKWTDFKDIQPADIWTLLGKLSKKN